MKKLLLIMAFFAMYFSGNAQSENPTETEAGCVVWKCCWGADVIIVKVCEKEQEISTQKSSNLLVMHFEFKDGKKHSYVTFDNDVVLNSKKYTEMSNSESITLKKGTYYLNNNTIEFERQSSLITPKTTK